MTIRTRSVSDWCELNEISIDELTEKSGLEQSRVMAIVMGRWTPSPAERKRIADVFAIGIEEIAWGHKTPIQHIYGHGPG